MSGTKGNGATKLAARQRQETDARIEAIFEKHGQLSRAQVVKISGIADSTVHLSIERLRKDGVLRKLTDRRRDGARGMMACIYEIGVEEDAPLFRGPVSFEIHRHPQDVAFFGEYQREAA